MHTHTLRKESESTTLQVRSAEPAMAEPACLPADAPSTAETPANGIAAWPPDVRDAVLAISGGSTEYPVGREGINLYRVAYRITRNQADAEDCMSKARLALFSLPAGLIPANVGAWLNTAVRNAALDVLRSRKGYAELPELAENVSTTYHTKILANQLLSLVSAEQAAVLQVVCEADNLKQAAYELGLSHGALRNILWRIRSLWTDAPVGRVTMPEWVRTIRLALGRGSHSTFNVVDTNPTVCGLTVDTVVRGF